MTHDDEKRNLKFIRAVFKAAQHRGIDNLTCGPYDEEVAEPPVENELRRHSGVDATEHGGKGSLPFHDGVSSFGTFVDWFGLSGRVAGVALDQSLERLFRAFNRELGSLGLRGEWQIATRENSRDRSRAENSCAPPEKQAS